MKEKVLVTGATGFLGTYITAQLIEEGFQVVGYGRREPSDSSEMGWLLKDYKDNGSYKFVNGGDISEYSHLLKTIKEEKISKIVHVAALTDLYHLKNNPSYSCRINLLSTMNILEACRLFDIDSVVFCSSIAVYAPKAYEPMDEHHPVHAPDKGPALFSYSTTKLSSEAFGMQYWADLGVNFSALRFSGIYGFGMRYPLYIKPILEPALEGEKVYFETGSEVARDLVYIEDAARAVCLTLNNLSVKSSQRIFNIGYGGELIKASEIVDTIKTITPDSQIYVGPGLSDLEERIQQARGSLDISKAEEYLGYKPEFDLGKGLREYVDYYMKYKDFCQKGG